MLFSIIQKYIIWFYYKYTGYSKKELNKNIFYFKYSLNFYDAEHIIYLLAFIYLNNLISFNK